MFSFFGLKRFSPGCAAAVPRCVRSNPWQHAGPRHKHDGRSCPRSSARLRRPSGWDTALGCAARHAPSRAASSPCPGLGSVPQQQCGQWRCCKPLRGSHHVWFSDSSITGLILFQQVLLTSIMTQWGQHWIRLQICPLRNLFFPRKPVNK